MPPRTKKRRSPPVAHPPRAVSIEYALLMFDISADTFERSYQPHLTDARRPENRGRERCKRYFFLDELTAIQEGGVNAVYTLRRALGRLPRA